MPPNPKVEGYLRKHKSWREPLQRLRQILLDAGLTEEIKWRVPCYTFEGHNIALFGCTKDHGALGFLKGALLKDPHNILVKPGPNSQAARMFRFHSVDDIDAVAPILKAYIKEAIENERDGLKIDFKKTEAFDIPAELQAVFKKRPDVKAAYDALTPGRQRSWLIHITAAKQSQTRTARIERAIPKILEGKGMHDR